MLAGWFSERHRIFMNAYYGLAQNTSRPVNPLRTPQSPDEGSSPSLIPEMIAPAAPPQRPHHCPSPSADCPTFQIHPRHPLSPFYPHLAESIVASLPHDARLALRATCKALRHTVDAVFVRSLIVTPVGLLSPIGRIPIRDLNARPELHSRVKAIDMVLLTALSSVNEAAITSLPILQDMSGLKIVRTSAEKALTRFETTRSVIRVFEPTYSNPGRRWTPWRLHARPLPNCERLVLLVLYHEPRDLTSAQLTPRFWNFPPSMKEVVLHVRPHPCPKEDITKSRCRPDNGFEGWSRLLGLLRALFYSGKRITLVGKGWDPAWILEDDPSHGFEEAWRAQCTLELISSGMEKEAAAAKVEEHFVFVSEEDYRAQVGETAWRVETAASLADLEEGEI
ncbi:hypothetical protein CC85DRAFT_300416 [Cutaneotrichosporon oleaginosum]|uniref:F-box domain-containing protein n=1 Tax=Cutaneotrichosporon oleaginosum TaxID=879819 RepID=A0A0J0XU52_9TREE|nr:uncharacterized protein CC85DRAFT_300416 [Cutaneotrichosporon oleaginosum]KLT44577.1 hypothetical protein CC85DRAFT_300416 [Cutaneotrichosporon oleaginosum]TXT13909.1 hypothetical protein COLE_00102 [Cutaneotrichosporon oleaginosum]